ncbi:tudor domain-containing protein 3-like isoform X2 [Acanthaster planci]|nr:tudor domain-containing protein 3-like isoform X2 [Acanthaster planci]
MVLQVQKTRNISAPKVNEDSGVAPPLLRLQLTDGHTTAMALVISNITKIGLSTPPGSKVKLTGAVACNHGFLLLTTSNCAFLGGYVKELVERWELAKSLYHHTRTAAGGSSGPPPWVPFGQRNKQREAGQKATKVTMKKSLEDPKAKEQTDQDKEFAEQRKAAIQEVNKSKPGLGKTFGGTKAPAAALQVKEGRETGRRGRDSLRNVRRGEQGDDQPATGKTRLDGIYRDLDYGGYQPAEKDIQQLVSMGFRRDAASNALRKHMGNADAAVEMLLKEPGPSEPQSQKFGRQRPDTRPDRSRGSGRRGRWGDDEEEGSAPPTGPATLFDFLQPKLGKDNETGSQSTGQASRKDLGRFRDFSDEQPSSVTEAGISFVHEGRRSNYKQVECQEGGHQKDNNMERGRRSYQEKSSSGRTDANPARKDGRGRNPDRNYGNKENSSFRDRNSAQDRHGDNRQGDSYQQRRNNTRGDGHQYNESRGNYHSSRNQQDNMSRGQDRPERNASFRSRDFQDNRPPRFQKQKNAQLSQVDRQPSNRYPNYQGVGNQSQPAETLSSNSVFSGSQTQQRPNLNPGDSCQAKYWEDNRFYDAVVTAIHPSGKTCVVVFSEYGNHEEVKMTDVRPLPSGEWRSPSPGPPVPSLLMSGKGGTFEGSTTTHLEFRQGGEGTVYTRPRQQREPRRNVRPAQSLYEPPSSRK